MARRATVKVRKSAVTRAEAAAEFGRNKARQRRKQNHRRVLMVGAVALALYLAVGSWWMVYTGVAARWAEASNTRFWNMTGGMGFTLDQVELVGRKHADAAEVKQALNITQGAPILALPLTEMKMRLEAVPEIKDVTIGRALPGTLRVYITERTPAALWQSAGEVKLIDRDGVVLDRAKYHEKMTLPIVVGADAPKHMEELIALLDTVPSLKPDVVAAVRVGGRRWNIQLARDITVMLPEDAPEKAWQKFSNLVNEKALLAKAIRSVDMRLTDRVFILPIDEDKPAVTLTSVTNKEI